MQKSRPKLQNFKLVKKKGDHEFSRVEEPFVKGGDTDRALPEEVAPRRSNRSLGRARGLPVVQTTVMTNLDISTLLNIL